MRRGIISDAHGNLVALEAAIAILRGNNVDAIYCLGDSVGYGPNPNRCVDAVQRACSVVLRGNHDEAACVYGGEEYFNSAAAKAICWTRSFLRRKGRHYLDYLATLPTQHIEGDIQYVHASPLDHMNEYVFPDDIWETRKMRLTFAKIDRGAFVGHTHVPGVFLEAGKGFEFHTPESVGMRFSPSPGQKFLVNAGSCGQPRDRDWRGCVCIFDGTTIEWLKFEYDVQETVRRMKFNKQLEPFLSQRLLEGR